MMGFIWLAKWPKHVVPVNGMLFILLCSTLLFVNSIAYGQLFPKNSPIVPADRSKPMPIISHATKPVTHNVKITSPVKGAKALVDNHLLISGISAGNHNATSINCHVSVIVNGIKPYRPTIAMGLSTPTDYSKWIFILDPTYTHIKAGQNKITAMYSCASNPRALSHYSVKVTGINPNINNFTGIG